VPFVDWRATISPPRAERALVIMVAGRAGSRFWQKPRAGASQMAVRQSPVAVSRRQKTEKERRLSRTTRQAAPDDPPERC